MIFGTTDAGFYNVLIVLCGLERLGQPIAVGRHKLLKLFKVHNWPNLNFCSFFQGLWFNQFVMERIKIPGTHFKISSTTNVRSVPKRPKSDSNF
jgi:hypothetical protein